MAHIPVLLDEVIEGLDVQPGRSFVDCTVGQAGHAARILERSSPDGLLLGLDADPRAMAAAAEKLKPYGQRVTLVNADFSRLDDIAADWSRGLGPALAGGNWISGILMDLGLSSAQLDDDSRGFSFQSDAPLDMRFGTEGPTAADLLNTLPERELAETIRRWGEEPSAHAFARAIVRNRPVRTTSQLARLLESVAGGRGKIHPATRTFQALRIAVNQEIDELSQALPKAVAVLKPGGRLAVISFHSLEDRIVKQYFRQESVDCVCPPKLPVCGCGHRATLRIITDKATVPTREEMRRNPRSRSAKLRVAERLGTLRVTDQLR
jgi:16S rRNA (cytosine1402-N4)-methyltransferase